MSSRVVATLTPSGAVLCSRSSKPACPCASSPETITCCEVRACADQICKPRIERIGDDQRPRPAVGQHEAVVVLGHQRVDRHRHHAGFERSRERPSASRWCRACTSRCALRGGCRARAAQRRSGRPARQAGHSSRPRADRCRPVWRPAPRRDCAAECRRRNCSRAEAS